MERRVPLGRGGQVRDRIIQHVHYAAQNLPLAIFPLHGESLLHFPTSRSPVPTILPNENAHHMQTVAATATGPFVQAVCEHFGSESCAEAMSAPARNDENAPPGRSRTGRYRGRREGFSLGRHARLCGRGYVLRARPTRPGSEAYAEPGARNACLSRSTGHDSHRHG